MRRSSILVVALLHDASYSDWKLGVTRNFAGQGSVALACSDTDARRSGYTNAEGHYLGRATAVLGVTRSF